MYLFSEIVKYSMQTSKNVDDAQAKLVLNHFALIASVCIAIKLHMF